MCARAGVDDFTRQEQPLYQLRMLAEAFVIKGMKRSKNNNVNRATHVTFNMAFCLCHLFLTVLLVEQHEGYEITTMTINLVFKFCYCIQLYLSLRQNVLIWLVFNAESMCLHCDIISITPFHSRPQACLYWIQHQPTSGQVLKELVAIV